jgi:hypothetical protein
VAAARRGSLLPSNMVNNLAAEAAFPSTLPSRTRGLYEWIVDLADPRGTCVEAKAVAGFIKHCSSACGGVGSKPGWVGGWVCVCVGVCVCEGGGG